MNKVNAFAVFGILFLSSILLANGMYSNSVSVLAQQENEAEVNADIKEQENKCKKDTECENENELNNQLSITNITQITTAESGPTTLNVIKILHCFEGNTDTENQIECKTLGPDDFTITVTGNNPSPSQFPGSSQGTLVTLGAGEYNIDESVTLPINGPDLEASASGDCQVNQQAKKIEGTIAEGETQTCIITNNVIFPA